MLLRAGTALLRPVGETLITGTAVGNNTFVFANAPFTRAYQRLRYEYFGMAVGTAYIGLWSYDADTDTVTLEDELSFTTATDEQSVEFDVDIKEGWVPGVYAYDGQGLIPIVTATGDGGGYLSNTSGHNTTSFSDSSFNTTYRFQHRFIGYYDYVNTATIEAIETALTDAETLLDSLTDSVIEAIGVDTDETLGATALATGSPVSNNCLAIMDSFAGGGGRTIDAYISEIKAYFNASGSGYAGVASLSGNDVTIRRLVALTWGSSGAATFTEGTDWTTGYLDILPGEYLFVNFGTKVDYKTATNPGYRAGSPSIIAEGQSFTQPTVQTAYEIQVNAKVRYRAVSDISYVVPDPPKVFDLFLGIGQSNEAGTAADYGVAPAEGIAYKWIGSALSTLADPTGNNGSTTLGSFWPAFAQHYFEFTGRGVILVNMARSGAGMVAGTGGSSGDWSSSGDHRGATETAIAALETYLDTNNFTWQWAGVVGHSHETDAIALHAENIVIADFEAALASTRTWLETATGMGSRMPWIITELGKRAGGTQETAWAAIRAAERAYVQATENVFMAWTGGKTLPARAGTWMEDDLHYNQDAQTERGKAIAAVAAARCVGLV